ncbi:MAG: hypothetical protein ACRCZF_15255, partial [Gemmataceae bacterium]
MRRIRTGEGPATLLPLAVLFLMMVFLAGCGSSTDTYDPTLRFPPRADVVVQRTPPTDPTARAHPLDRETFLMQLGAKGGTITNPAELSAADQAELTAALEE